MGYLQAHPEASQRVLAVVSLSRLGAWEQLAFGPDLDAPAPKGGLCLQGEGAERERREGICWLREMWARVLDLGDPGALDQVERELAGPCGLGESPDWLIERARAAARDLGVPAEARCYCPGAVHHLPFQYRGLATLAVCGEGNDLADTPYDTLETIRVERLGKAAAFVYQLIVELGRNP